MDTSVFQPVRPCTVAFVVIATALTVLAGCDVNGALEKISKARQFASDMHVQFGRASDAANRAVMADSDELSATFSREASTAAGTVQQDMDALAVVLEELKFSQERSLLAEFRTCFAAYREQDRAILALAGKNTNLKAQRLSFGAAAEQANAFRDALQAVLPAASGERGWHARALVEIAVGSVREIQALQAPHIAEPGDNAMVGLEKRMTAAEAAARGALRDLSALLGPSAQTRLSAATVAMDRLMEVHAQIIDLSRQNSNVRSLALSLNQKRAVVVPCEEALRALNEALAQRGFSGTR